MSLGRDFPVGVTLSRCTDACKEDALRLIGVDFLDGELVTGVDFDDPCGELLLRGGGALFAVVLGPESLLSDLSSIKSVLIHLEFLGGDLRDGIIIKPRITVPKQQCQEIILLRAHSAHKDIELVIVVEEVESEVAVQDVVLGEALEVPGLEG